MVLPDRIELSTSPLPMECSTTELRQHARYSGNRPKRLPLGGRFLPQGPLWRKHAGRSGTGQNGQKSARAASEPVQSGQLGPDPVPVGPEPPNHDLNCFAARGWTLTGCGNLPKQAIATRRGETHYVPARRRGVAANPVSIQILFRSKSRFDQGQFRRTCDEGRSRQGRRKDRHGREGFTTGPAEAGAARKSQAAKVPGEGAQRCRRRIFRKRRRLPR